MHRIIRQGLTLALGLSLLAGAVSAQAPDDQGTPTATPGPSSSLPATTGEVAEGPGSSSADQPGGALEATDELSGAAIDFAQPVWREISPQRGPAAREDHTWTVDGDGRYAYLFGGRDGTREFGDLWRYDLRRDRWQRLAPAGRTPAPRFGHSAVWVAGLGVVLFAGQQGTRFFADLWAYDPAAERWRKLLARGGAPRPRYGSCMVVGPDGRLWISHGFTTAGRFDDTRAYHLERRRWTSIARDAGRPGERCLHDCFTTAAGDLVLYGGQDDGSFALGDLWVMGRDRSWAQRSDPQPRPRRLYAVAEAGAAAYVFGGAGEDGRAFGDLWRVDRATLAFERVPTLGPAPSPRYAGTLISDPARGRLLLFGGQADRARADVWELVEAGEPAPGEQLAEASPTPLP